MASAQLCWGMFAKDAWHMSIRRIAYFSVKSPVPTYDATFERVPRGTARLLRFVVPDLNVKSAKMDTCVTQVVMKD